jgi:hypothetical protein
VTDVFHEASGIKWCWVAATNESETETATCDNAMQLVLLAGCGKTPFFGQIRNLSFAESKADYS